MSRVLQMAKAQMGEPIKMVREKEWHATDETDRVWFDAGKPAG
jgi:hypothetical protein